MPDSTFITDIEIRDTDQFTETAKQWQADFVQLDRGPFRSAIKQIGFTGTQMGECSLSRKLHQKGLSPQGGRTFIVQKVPTPGASRIWDNSLRNTAQCLESSRLQPHGAGNAW